MEEKLEEVQDHAAAQLRETLLRTATGCAIFTTDADGIITTWSKAAEGAFGWAPEEIIGKSCSVLYPFEERQKGTPKAELQQALDTGAQNNEGWHRRKDASQFWARGETVPLRDHADVLQGFLKILRDHTEEREAARKLRASETYLRTLLDSTAEGIFAVDRDGIVTVCNAAFLRLLGFAAKENVVGRPLHELLGHVRASGQAHPAGACPTCRCAKNGAAIHLDEEFFHRQDGARMAVEYWVHPLLHAGQHKGAICTFFDITERRRTEDALRDETRTLEVLNRTGAALVAELDLQRLLQQVTDAGVDLTGAKFGAFFYNLSSDAGESLKLYTLSGVDRSHFERFPAPRNTALFAPTFSGEAVVRSDDILADPRYGKNAPFHGMPAGHLPVRSYLAVPVVSRRGEVSGALLFAHPEPGKFNERHERLMIGVAAETAIAIDNARLYQAAQQANETLEQRIVEEVARRSAAEEELRLRNEAELIRISNSDPLTGLANRRVLNQRIMEWRAQEVPRPGALLFCDLDRFKTVNDSLGHYAGDELLHEVAGRLSRLVADNQLLVRLGGDEFVIFCEGADEHEASTLAQDILNAFGEPFLIAGGPHRASLSIGIAHAETGADDLLREADAAMYAAKRQGGNRQVIFQNTMHKKVLPSLRMEQDLFLAIDRREFVLYFQPIVALSDARIIALEALVRWNHPERGIIPPAEFIPLAEETGLITKIGSWVAAEAVSQFASLHDPSLTLTINVAAQQLVSGTFAQELRDSLVANNLGAGFVTIEVTESTLMEDDAVRELKAVQQMGCRVAIDDFGTGYSSLAYLRRLPVDMVKVDRSFISPLGEDAKARNLLRAMVVLAHTLDLQVVAEGVETDDQRRILALTTCDAAQGFLFGQPRPIEQIDFAAAP